MAFTPPAAHITDAPSVCLEINATWVGYVLGVLEKLARPSAWLGTEAEQDAAAQQIEQLMRFSDMYCAPTGTIWPFAGETPPFGWLICDGSTITRSEYAVLFSVLAPDSPEFVNEISLPDLRGRALIGATEDTGVSDIRTPKGAASVTLTAANVPPLPIEGKWGTDPNHIHASGQVNSGLAEAPSPNGGAVRAGFTVSGDGSGGAVPVPIVPPSYTVNFIIRT